MHNHPACHENWCREVWYSQCKCYGPPGGSGWKDPPTNDGDGGGSGSGGNNTSSQPLKKTITLTKEQKTFVVQHGRDVRIDDPNHVTVGDLLKWALQNNTLWRWTCTNVFHASGNVCKDAPGVKPLTAGDWAWDGALEIAKVGQVLSAPVLVAVTCLETDGAACGAGDSEAVANVTQTLEEEGEPEAVATAFEDMVASDSDTALDAVCGADSFDPKTLVLLADGKKKPIGKVKVGDRVKSTDPVTNTTRDELVTQLHRNLDEHLADLTINAGGRDAVLHTTANHLFWDLTTGRWAPAASIPLATGSPRPATSLRR